MWQADAGVPCSSALALLGHLFVPSSPKHPAVGWWGLQGRVTRGNTVIVTHGLVASGPALSERAVYRRSTIKGIRLR